MIENKSRKCTSGLQPESQRATPRLPGYSSDMSDKTLQTVPPYNPGSQLTPVRLVSGHHGSSWLWTCPIRSFCTSHRLAVTPANSGFQKFKICLAWSMNMVDPKYVIFPLKTKIFINAALKNVCHTPFVVCVCVCANNEPHPTCNQI